jgi:hypothetical protein
VSGNTVLWQIFGMRMQYGIYRNEYLCDICVCACVCDESRGFVRVVKAKIRVPRKSHRILTGKPQAQHKLSKSRTQYDSILIIF